MLIRLDYKFSCKIFILFLFSIYIHVSLQGTPVFVGSFVYLLPMRLGYEANVLFVRSFCLNDGFIF